MMVSSAFRPQEQLLSSSAPWHWEPCLYILKRRLTGFLIVLRLGSLLLHQEKLTSNCHGGGELQPHSPGSVLHIIISAFNEPAHRAPCWLLFPRVSPTTFMAAPIKNTLVWHPSLPRNAGTFPLLLLQLSKVMVWAPQREPTAGRQMPF